MINIDKIAAELKANARATLAGDSYMWMHACPHDVLALVEEVERLRGMLPKECGFCGGSGKLMRGTECRTCNGTGRSA